MEDNTFNHWKSGQLEIVKFLLGIGVDVNGTTDDVPPISVAIYARNGSTDIAEFLIKHGANVNVAYNHRSPLLFAVESGKI